MLLKRFRIDILNIKNYLHYKIIKSKYLGPLGKITLKFKNIINLKKKTKINIGKILNNVKKYIENFLEIKLTYLNKINLLKNNKKKSEDFIDITLPCNGENEIGTLHPITQTIIRIEDIFIKLGFTIVDSPEVETDLMNFTALNNPKNHPARSMQDTFYINKKDNYGKNLLMRTHTSSIQIRYSKNLKPPIKIITIGKVYRIDNDSNHSHMFHQFECFWIDKNINFSNLKYIYINFIKKFFMNKNINIRFRPSYFPFTEPSAEIDINFSKNKSKNNWIEIAGAGKIHPNVIKNMNLDNNKYNGFAFGTGIERLTMIYNKIYNIKLFYNNNINFLKQFI